MSKGERNREKRPPGEAEVGKNARLLDAVKATTRKVGEALSGLSNFQRLGIVLAALALAAAAHFALPYIHGSEHVDLQLKAGQGTSTFSLAPESDAVSPGCGCPHPEWGKHPWEGMSVPSRGFRLDVDSEPSDEIDPELWSLTAMAPNTGAIDWYGGPNRALWIVVEAHKPSGWWRTLFYGATSYFMLWTPNPVSVRQSREFPYAAVLPAAGGSTTFTAHEPSRDQWAGTVDVSTTTPSRSAANLVDASSDTNISQRGPMIDVLGPELTLSTRNSKQLRLWAGQKEITRAHPGQHITVKIYTPFAVRFIPHPVQTDWRSTVARETEGTPTGLLAGTTDEPDEASRGRGRIPLIGPLPSYTVRMGHIRPPGASWAPFAKHSSKEEMIAEMTEKTSLDPLPTEVWKHPDYGLPPVTSRPQIGVFGRITKFDSTSVDGAAVIGSDTRAIPQGEELQFDSDDGLEAGRYHFTPLVSAGQETTETSIYGVATMFIGGDLASHPGWLPSDTISFLATLILGVFISAAVNLSFDRKEEPGR